MKSTPTVHCIQFDNFNPKSLYKKNSGDVVPGRPVLGLHAWGENIYPLYNIAKIGIEIGKTYPSDIVLRDRTQHKDDWLIGIIVKALHVKKPGMQNS